MTQDWFDALPANFRTAIAKAQVVEATSSSPATSAAPSAAPA